VASFSFSFSEDEITIELGLLISKSVGAQDFLFFGKTSEFIDPGSV
jgi:hypothetical protein